MSSGENRAVQCNGGVVGGAIALRATRWHCRPRKRMGATMAYNTLACLHARMRSHRRYFGSVSLPLSLSPSLTPATNATDRPDGFNTGIFHAPIVFPTQNYLQGENSARGRNERWMGSYT